MKLSEICNLIPDIKVISDGEFESLGLAVAECDKELLSFIESDKYIKNLKPGIKCLITTEEIGEKLKDKYGVIISKNPRIDYFKIHNVLSSVKGYKVEKIKTSYGERCHISESAIISKNNVIIGNNVIIEENVIIRENTTIGDNCIIRAGCIIGGEGFEFKRNGKKIMNVIHCGGVYIENNVELQYNTCIDKALYPWDNTIIGAYTKIDNFVHIEHAVKVGERCIIASRTVIGGRTEIGKDSWLGLGVIVSNGLVVGDKSYISLGAVVTKDISEAEKVSGNFAIEHSKYIEFIKKIR